MGDTKEYTHDMIDEDGTFTISGVSNNNEVAIGSLTLDMSEQLNPFNEYFRTLQTVEQDATVFTRIERYGDDPHHLQNLEGPENQYGYPQHQQQLEQDPSILYGQSQQFQQPQRDQTQRQCCCCGEELGRRSNTGFCGRSLCRSRLQQLKRREWRNN